MDIAAKKDELEKHGESIGSLKRKLAQEKENVEQRNAKQGKLEDDIRSYKKMNGEEVAMRRKLNEDNATLQAELKNRSDEVQSLKNQQERIHKNHEALRKKKISDDEEKRELEASRNELRAE